MVSKFVLLTNLLLASAALAAPSRLEARLARRRQNRQLQPASHVDGPAGAVSNVVYSPTWSGAVLTGDPGTFTCVTGTFIVPSPSGSAGSAASAWVGIDGDTCQNTFLQTGVDFTVDGGYDAWCEWYPDYAYDFSGISISAGDVIKATVTVTSTTSGTAAIENMTTGQTVTQELTSSYALCEQDAEWIVQELEDGGSLGSFANFGNVTFTDASACGPGGTYTPSGATVIEIEGLTSVTVSGSGVAILYE